jgi:hypothetical protein
MDLDFQVLDSQSVIALDLVDSSPLLLHTSLDACLPNAHSQLCALEPNSSDVSEEIDVDDLFAEESTAGSSDSTRVKKHWSADEELCLCTFLQKQSQHRKIRKADWVDLSHRMNRSISSLCSKAALIRKAKTGLKEEAKVKTTLREAIETAIKSLPEQKGSKTEIVGKIAQLQPHLTGDTWRRSVKQILSVSFRKTLGRYKQKPGVVSKPASSCTSMSDYVTWALSESSSLTLVELKVKIRTQFLSALNEAVSPESALCTWEKTLLKKLQLCKTVDFSSATTTFSLP